MNVVGFLTKVGCPVFLTQCIISRPSTSVTHEALLLNIKLRSFACILLCILLVILLIILFFSIIFIFSMTVAYLIGNGSVLRHAYLHALLLCKYSFKVFVFGRLRLTTI